MFPVLFPVFIVSSRLLSDILTCHCSWCWSYVFGFVQNVECHLVCSGCWVVFPSLWILQLFFFSYIRCWLKFDNIELEGVTRYSHILHQWWCLFIFSYCTLKFFSSYIDHAVGLIDENLVADLAWDFADFLAFQVDVRFAMSKMLLIFLWAVNVITILFSFGVFSICCLFFSRTVIDFPSSSFPILGFLGLRLAYCCCRNLCLGVETIITVISCF